MRTRTLIRGCAFLLLLGLAVTPLCAQQSTTPPEVQLWPVGPPPETSYRPWDPYEMNFMVELGGQIADVNGNQDVWDSQQNYRDGFKVYNFNFHGQAKDSGAFLSDFYAEGGGWVNEPYSWVRFGFSKDKWFDFRGQFRESEYNWFFPGFARSQHFNDTQRRLQDYKLTLFPKQKFRVKLGYSRNSSFGPTYTTLDFSRGEFPVFEPLRQTYDQYTIGAEWNIQRWLIIGEYGYRLFRNDRMLELLEEPSLPNDTADAARLFEWDRMLPSRGKIPYGSLNIVGRPLKNLEANARIVYSGGKTEFTRNEFFDGMTFAQGGANPSTTILMEQLAFGESKRPMTTVNGNLTWRPVPKFTVTNNFEYYGYDITGFSDETRDITCGNGTTAGCPLNAVPAVPGDPLSGEQRSFLSTFFNLNTYRNRTEGRYQFTDWLSARGGFYYVHRNFRHAEFEQLFEDGVLEDEALDVDGFDFINRSWLFGADLRFNRKLQIFFDGEVGDNTRVFTRTSPADMDRYRLRGKFEPLEGLKFNASWFIFDNQNFDLPLPTTAGGTDTVPARYSSLNRGFSIDFQLTRFERGFFDIGYSRNDITTNTDVAFFSPYQIGNAMYFVNDNYFYFDISGRLVGRLYADAGYRVVDTSSNFPPSDPVDACVPLTTQQCVNLTGLDALGVFEGGIKYHMPYAGLRYALNDNVTWKGGWRWYGYDQDGGAFSDYRTHVITTSLVLNF